MNQTLMNAAGWIIAIIIYAVIGIALLNMENRGAAVTIGILLAFSYVTLKQIEKLQNSVNAAHRKLDELVTALDAMRRRP